jgi:ubiquinone/menaquinone biosynthesis C-methylase UbiE
VGANAVASLEAATVSRSASGSASRLPEYEIAGVILTREVDEDGSMATTDKAFTGSIPETYERYLVPLLFESYAQDMAERVKRLAPRDILETAAGTGVVTRAMASVLPSSTRLVATDLNDAMLEVARRGLTHHSRLEWNQADALALPMESGSFDVVICQFGVMFFPEKGQGFREALRVLRPAGRYLFSVWGNISENEFADVVTDALAEIFPHDPPRFLARTPHGYHDADHLRREVIEAGFSDVQVETVEHLTRCGSSRDVAVAYCQGTPLQGEIVARDPAGLERATLHASGALAKRFGDGPIEGKSQAIFFTAAR